MKKDPRIFLDHILESIKDIEEYIEKLNKEDFLKDKKTQDAVMRRLEIIGEAVKRLSPDLKKKSLKTRWKEIAGMRDILIHEYFGIHLNIVWGTVKKDIPKLKKELKNLMKNLEKKSQQLRIKEALQNDEI